MAGWTLRKMEGYLVSYYEYHFLYITGIEHVESKSIQNIGLRQALLSPGYGHEPGSGPDRLLRGARPRLHAARNCRTFRRALRRGSVPVGQLVFSSEARGVGEIQDLALFRVRPMFATLARVSAPPPFGATSGRWSSMSIRKSSTRITCRLRGDQSGRSGNTIVPAGNVRIGDLNRFAPLNSVVSDIQELAALPIRTGMDRRSLCRDVGRV